MSKITILGSGGFGIGLALMFTKYNHNVTVWSAFQSEIDAIKRDGENKEKLPGIHIPESVNLSTDISCISGSDIVIFGIPTLFVRKVARQAAPFITSEMVVVNTGKGFEEVTLKRMSEVIGEEISNAPIVVMSGPSHAEEVALSIPTTIVVSCRERKYAEYVQDNLSNPYLRMYVSDDVIGCEIGGALKNIIALCAGICDGMKYGDNTKAALMTRGMSEIARLGVSMGANIQTFSGLTGIGDLIVTCTSMHSRNRRAGILIGEGVTPDEAVNRVGTVEGYYCCKNAYELSKKMGADLPITEQLYLVLFNGKNVSEALKDLMGRPKRHESEEVWASICSEKD